MRDGLKPVHRRLLYAMRLLRLDPNTAAKKSARVVGDVIGKYHPHGDTAVYDALVRLAQDFAQRYRLIDGQGNFGNIDGDNAAAMRYTECRLTEAAQLLLDGIDEDAVDLRETYDGQEEEPVVLPAGFPNLLANGSSGIAVGMATSIPPHNAGELIDACLAAAQETLRDHRRPARARPGSGLSHRRRDRRGRGLDAGDLRDRPGRHALPGAVGEGGHRPGNLAGGDHRDSLSGPQGRSGRTARRPDRDQEGARCWATSATSRPRTCA